jgi:hypothetical protein
MVVNGKYMTSATMATVNNPTASGHAATIEVTNWLIAREAALLKKGSK